MSGKRMRNLTECSSCCIGWSTQTACQLSRPVIFCKWNVPSVHHLWRLCSVAVNVIVSILARKGAQALAIFQAEEESRFCAWCGGLSSQRCGDLSMWECLDSCASLIHVPGPCLQSTQVGAQRICYILEHVLYLTQQHSTKSQSTHCPTMICCLAAGWTHRWWPCSCSSLWPCFQGEQLRTHPFLGTCLSGHCMPGNSHTGATQ